MNLCIFKKSFSGRWASALASFQSRLRPHTRGRGRSHLLNVPDPVYNWLVDFFSDHKHCTSFGDSVSAYQPISASIIQGSAIGPVSFVVNASDLSTVTPGNRMHKYADDTYIVIPACNNRTREVELDHVALWAQENNLKLNRANNLY